MELIIKLDKEDINTGNIGNNYQVVTKKGLMIIFDKEAIEELVRHYQYDRETEKTEKSEKAVAFIAKALNSIANNPET